MKKMILKSRYTLLGSIILLSFLIIMMEGIITGREAGRLDFDNPWISIDINEQ
ncbi:MAG: hypothetical protein RQ757_10775 [Pseudomonadales bacterium]|nr:hypothetical protein [Pseudomonadales bacterium]